MGLAFWLLILGMGVVTYALRLGPILLLDRMDLPPVLGRALRFVPAAVLAALIAPEVLRPGGALDLTLGNARLGAGILAALVAWRTRNVLFTIAAGMVALWVAQALGR